MDINRKIELAEQHIVSISRHDDIDAAIRNAALDKVATAIQTERNAMALRVKAAIEEALKPPAQVAPAPVAVKGKR